MSQETVDSVAIEETDVVVAYRLRTILDEVRERMDRAEHYALSRMRRIGINSRDEGIGINTKEPDGSV